ncbi:hypothetical protein DBO85_13990 [Pseudomonas mangrovi]|uniref:DUF6868 domain-containing protein n=2 Tax=Pseudomonas mangrovi TaxID=2161748 RepID=A0A2T5P7Z8_9PSED|nr:hypothetical protein DBO85_13990 [Pseudomonas mangrovi]
MTTDALAELLLWCSLAHYVILLLWFAGFVCARERILRLHGRWFRLSENQFDAIHYSAMAIYKLLILFFGLVPAIVLKLIG